MVGDCYENIEWYERVILGQIQMLECRRNIRKLAKAKLKENNNLKKITKLHMPELRENRTDGLPFIEDWFSCVWVANFLEKRNVQVNISRRFLWENSFFSI